MVSAETICTKRSSKVPRSATTFDLVSPLKVIQFNANCHCGLNCQFHHTWGIDHSTPIRAINRQKHGTTGKHGTMYENVWLNSIYNQSWITQSTILTHVHSFYRFANSSQDASNIPALKSRDNIGSYIYVLVFHSDKDKAKSLIKCLIA